MDEVRERAEILIIDDNPTNLEVMIEYLTDQGYEMYAATDGPAALELLGQVTPDLVLLDMMMPHMDGLETCRRIRALPQGARMPIIFMTAMADTSDRQRGFAAGASDYITKPFDLPEVTLRISTYVELSRLRRRVTACEQALHEVDAAVMQAQAALSKGSESAAQQALSRAARAATMLD